MREKSSNKSKGSITHSATILYITTYKTKASRACLRRSPTQSYAFSLAALLKEAALGLIEALAPPHKIADALADKAAWQPQGSPAETQQELLARLLLPLGFVENWVPIGKTCITT